MYVIITAVRKKQYDHIFTNGEYTKGRIVSIDSGDVYCLVKFEFELDNLIYRGITEYSDKWRRYWSEGAIVAVLYNPENPTQNCIIHG